jgi:hypothetical protein
MKNNTAANEHIGSMAALPPLEKAVRNASLSPAGKYLEAATAPICQNVSSNMWTAQPEIAKDENDNETV